VSKGRVCRSAGPRPVRGWWHLKGPRSACIQRDRASPGARDQAARRGGPPIGAGITLVRKPAATGRGERKSGGYGLPTAKAGRVGDLRTRGVHAGGWRRLQGRLEQRVNAALRRRGDPPLLRRPALQGGSPGLPVSFITPPLTSGTSFP